MKRPCSFDEVIKTPSPRTYFAKPLVLSRPGESTGAIHGPPKGHKTASLVVPGEWVPCFDDDSVLSKNVTGELVATSHRGVLRGS